MKTVRNVKNSLKFKVQPKVGLLSLKVGKKRYSLPVEARIVTGEKYIFLSFGSNSEIYCVEGAKLRPMHPTEDGTGPELELNAVGSRGSSRRRSKVSLPSELEAALKMIPEGYKLVYDLKTGEPRLTKKRPRMKSS